MIALLFFANTHLRDVFWYDVFCEAILFLEPNSTRSVLHCGRGNEKQTRTLTDTEDCCEDVCIVLICGWSVDVYVNTPPRTVPFGTCPLNVNTHTEPRIAGSAQAD